MSNTIDELQEIKNILEEKFNVDERINKLIIESYINNRLLTDLFVDSELVKEDFESLKEEVISSNFKEYIEEVIHPRYFVRSIYYGKRKRKKAPSLTIHIKAKGVFTDYDTSKLEYTNYKDVFKKYAKRAVFNFTLLNVILSFLISNYMPVIKGINMIVILIVGFASVFNSIFANMFLYLNYEKNKNMSPKIFGYVFGFISFFISIILMFGLFTLIS